VVRGSVLLHNSARLRPHSSLIKLIQHIVLYLEIGQEHKVVNENPQESRTTGDPGYLLGYNGQMEIDDVSWGHHWGRTWPPHPIYNTWSVNDIRLMQTPEN